MKLNRKNLFLLASLTLTLTAPAAFAANLYWDINGVTPGAGGATPSGTWATLGTTWSTDSTGATATSALTTANIDDLTFSAGTDATGSYTVTFSGSQTAKTLRFEDGAAQIGVVGGGSTLTLAGGGGIIVDTTATGATISSAFTLNGNNTFNVKSGKTLTVNGTSFTRGTRATLNVQGDGTVAAPVATGTLGTALSGATIAPWASIGTGASTSYAKIDADNITALGYTGGADGTSVGDASGVTDTGGTVDYDAAAVGTLGAGASINTLRYTGAAGTIAGDLATKGIMNSGSGLLGFSGAVTAGASGNELVLNAANGPIAPNGQVTGAIVKTGSGTVTLGGTPVHSLGVWTVNEGTLALNTAATPEIIPSGTVNNGATMRLLASNRVANGAVFTINAGGTVDLNGQGDLIGGFSGAGSVISTGGTFQLGNATQTFSGVISGGLNLVKRNGGEQTLSGANTFTGTTTLNNPGTSATLTLGNPLALQNSALATTSSSAGTTAIGLKTTVTTLTLGGLAGNKDLASLFRQDATGGPGGTTALGGYAGVTALTLNPAASVTRDYTAVIADGAPGMTLTKTGAGTQVLSGINSYTGATAVNNGTLLVNSPGSLASTSAVTVAAGAALGGNGTINGTVNVAADGLLAPGGADTIGTLTLANNSASALTLNGKNALLFDLPNTVTTGDLIAITGQLVLNGASYISLRAPNGPVPEGSYTLMTYSGTSGSGSLTFQNGTTTFGNATLTVGPTSVTLDVGVGGLTGLSTWSGSVSGVWDDGALNWTKDGVASSAYTDGDAVTFNDVGSTAATISSVAPVAPDSVLFNNTAKNYTVSAVIAGGTTLAKTGSGTTTLTGVNTFTGGVTISGGTLGTSGSGRLGTSTNNIYAGEMSIAPGATYNVAGASQRLSGPVTGGGTLRNSSGNDLILDNTGNSYGALTINGGRTFLNSNAGVLPAAATVTVTGGNLIFGFGTTRNNAISVSSGGILTARNPTTLTSVTLPGSGTAIFNNDDANTRLITINNGQTLTGALTVQIGGSRMLAGTTLLGGVTLAGNLTGGGSLVVASSGNFANNPTLFGTGTLTLAGTNSYTGTTTVTAGTLAVTGTLGATAVTVDSPATLGGNGNIGGDVTINAGATHALAVAATPGAQVTRAITGTLTLTPGNLLNLTAAATPAAGEYVLATADTITGTTAEIDINYNGISGTVSVDTASNPDRLLLTAVASGFSAWIEGPFTNAIPLDQQGPNDDPDNDGISNLVEFAVANQDPTVGNTNISTFDGITLSFDKRQPLEPSLTYVIEESIDLGSPTVWTPVTGGVNSSTIISYALTPGTPVRNFLRLQVISN